MASSYFCPEDPRPLAVISESYRGEVKGQLPELPPWERYSLGEEYERELFALLHQYLELSTTDTLCYVGDTRDHMIYRLEDHFCLIKPVQTVAPGLVHYEETKDNKMVPFHISHVGAEEFFRLQVKRQSESARGKGSGEPVKFDKILVHDACRYLSEPHSFYTNLMQCLTPGGIVLILHRPGRLSTLPFFKEAHSRLAENDVPYMNIVHDLYRLPHLSVQYELESVPVRIGKRKWLAMVRDRYPPNMHVMSHKEVLAGLRELTEGVLKYEGDQVEFDDCLLFVKVTRRTSEKSRASSAQSQPQPNPLLHNPPVTPPQRRDLKLSLTLPPDTKPALHPASQSTFKFLWD